MLISEDYHNNNPFGIWDGKKGELVSVSLPVERMIGLCDSSCDIVFGDVFFELDEQAWRVLWSKRYKVEEDSYKLLVLILVQLVQYKILLKIKIVKRT